MIGVELTCASGDWASFASDRSSYTFLWQDLDGLHMSALPSQPPLTSLLHGWSQDGRTLVRARIDGSRVRAAVITPNGANPSLVTLTKPWGEQRRVSGATTLGPVTLATQFIQVELLDDGEGALVFFAPDGFAGLWR